ncbi:MAG: PRC-barrel domain-containing protein [Acidimicrobiales bacterium]
MSQGTEFTIGSEVACSDGACGVLSRVVVDPLARALTHLVVEPRHPSGLGRLVPIGLVDSSSGDIRIGCTVAEFETLEPAEETRFLPGATGEWGYGQGQMLSWPYYGLGGMGGMGIGGIGMGGLGAGAMGTVPPVVSYDKVPTGEVDVKRGERVHATDGAIGRVQGLVIDPGDHHVTHVLLDEGHLWGQKRVAIPISVVTGVEDGVRLSLTKEQVRELPPVDVVQPD